MNKNLQEWIFHFGMLKMCGLFQCYHL